MLRYLLLAAIILAVFILEKVLLVEVAGIAANKLRGQNKRENKNRSQETNQLEKQPQVIYLIGDGFGKLKRSLVLAVVFEELRQSSAVRQLARRHHGHFGVRKPFLGWCIGGLGLFPFGLLLSAGRLRS